MANIRRRVRELTADRFETGLEPLRVRILTFANINCEGAIKSYLTKVERVSKFDPVFSTLDSFMNEVLRPEFKVNYKRSTHTIGQWVNYLKDGVKLPGLSTKALEFCLFQILEGKITIDDGGFSERDLILFIDESQDIKPRHLIFLMILIATGKVSEIHLYGDRQQCIDTKSVDLSRFRRHAMSWVVNPEDIYPLIVSKLKPTDAPDIELIERIPVSRTLRNSKEYIESSKKSTFRDIQKVFEGPDTALTSTKIDPNNIIIETTLGNLPRDAGIRTILLDRNLLNTNKLDQVANFQARAALNLANKLGSKLVCFVCREVIEDLEEAIKNREGEMYQAALEDCYADNTPKTSLGRFLYSQIFRDLNAAESFILFLDLYYEMLQNALGKDSNFQKLGTGLRHWINALRNLDSHRLSKKLHSLGLTSISSWFKLIRMDKEQSLIDELSLDGKYIFAWTVHKAKGQTFGDSTAILWIPDNVPQNPHDDSHEIKDNKLYTMLTRTQKGSYILF